MAGYNYRCTPLLAGYSYRCTRVPAQNVTADSVKTVSGMVLDDETGDGLLGATVQVLNGTSGTITDVDGRYELTAPPGATLVFSYLGYATKREKIGTRTTVNVRLRPAENQLASVVVTGYGGAQETKDLVGSYSEVGTEQLAAERPVESIDQLLEGRIAGLQIETVTGEPGLPIRVNLRGSSALPGNLLNASTQPLYILDGVPLYDVLETNNRNTFFSDANNQLLNPLAFINPDDVASVTVLKDASAAAIYGADAANGVILITTKSGRAGRTKVNVSASVGTARPINEIQYLNTEQYLELARESLFNAGMNPADAGRSDVDTDWRGLALQNPSNADVDLSVSGGAGEMTYRLSAGYNQLESAHRRNGLEQANLSLNLTLPISEKLDLTTRFTGSFQRKESLRSFDVFSFPPNLPVRNADGSFNNDGFFARRANPAALLEQNENEHASTNLNGKLSLNYRPLPSLTFRGLVGLDNISGNQFQYRSALNGSGARWGGRLIRTANNNVQWIANAQVRWQLQTEGPHHLAALLGTEANSQNRYRQVTNGDGFPFDDLRRLAVLPQANIDAAESSFERNRLSQYAEVSYDYAYRYYLKLNARRDATSIFGGDRQADVFWAAGAGWTLSEFPVLRDRLPFGVDFAKLRGSYGLTGNSRLGVYTTGGVYQQLFADDAYGGALPAIVSAPANDLLGWQRDWKTNLGLDLGWRERRYGLTLEYYSNRTVDGLFSFRVPREAGFQSILGNGYSVRNWGFELTFNFATPEGRNWQYRGSLNAARNYNRLLDIALSDAQEAAATNRFFIIGESTDLIWGIPFAGVDPETGAGLYRLPSGETTSERAAILDERNFSPIGRSLPTVFGGLHQTLEVGAFSIMLQINYSLGGDIRVDRLTFTDGQQIVFNNQSVNQLDRWQQPGDVASVPRLSVDNPAVSRSSRYVFRNDFLQFGALSLGYDLTKLPLLGDRLRGGNIYALVNNLGYIYGGERRAGRNGVAEYRFTFPQQRAFVFGLKIGL